MFLWRRVDVIIAMGGVMFMRLTKFLQSVRQWFWESIPAIMVLLLSILLPVLFSDISHLGRWEAIYKTFFRFFRFTLFLCLPLYMLLPVYRTIVSKRRGTLVQIGKRQEVQVLPLKHWVFRPFQGIGIGLLFETKLLTVLQVITGEPATPFQFFPTEQFEAGRFVAITGITVVISLLLSTLWTLDDMGIRYINQKDDEMKMIGKYAGTLMPIIFGFYGLFSLAANFPKGEAFIYLFKIVIALYPPFAVFVVFYNNFLKSRKDHFSQGVSLEVGGVWRKG
jgi:hypothetical protein